jgi:hypothetical protein
MKRDGILSISTDLTGSELTYGIFNIFQAGLYANIEFDIYFCEKYNDYRIYYLDIKIHLLSGA